MSGFSSALKVALVALQASESRGDDVQLLRSSVALQDHIVVGCLCAAWYDNVANSASSQGTWGRFPAKANMFLSPSMVLVWTPLSHAVPLPLPQQAGRSHSGAIPKK